MSEGERRLAAVMFADVAGYTALTERNESHALQVVSKVKELSLPILQRHWGRLVKTMGDGLLVEFSSAMDAVLCGIELQHAIREQQSAFQGQETQLRIGIHVGDITIEKGDILGDAVNVASRIETLADPGEICISSAVLNQVKSRLTYATISMGPQTLKNVAAPVETYKVLLPWAGESPVAAAPEVVTRDNRRLLVLPLNSFSPDPNDEYFADGMTEEIITKLSFVRGLRVIARTSSMKYKGVRKSASEIGTELDVGSILEGSVRKSGERMRITLQLIDALTEEHLWANSYDRNLTDVFAIQSDIAERVAGALEVRLRAKEVENLKKSDTENLDAYTDYLRGRDLLVDRSEKGMKEARKFFEKAIAKDPRFARAYSGLADCLMIMASYTFIPAIQAYEEARPLIIKALELDDGLAEAHASMGLLMTGSDLNWAGAEREFKKAIEINPGYALAHHWYANLLSTLARGEEMISEINVAMELDPLSVGILNAAAIGYYYHGDSAKALMLAERALEQSPTNRGAKFMSLFILSELGRTGEALAIARKWKEEEPRADAIAVLAWLLLKSGNFDEGKLLLDQLESMLTQNRATKGDIWFDYVLIGDLDKAFEYHNAAVESRDNDVSIIRMAPGLEPMRADPRYHELMKKLKLE